MIAVRRNMGIFQKAAAMFEILRYHNLSPHTPGSANVFASTGFVGIESSRWWGSSQAVLSLAVTQLRARTRIALPTYNIPAHLLKEAKTFGVDITLQNAILVHYHWLLHSKFIKREKILYGGEDLPANVLLWLRSRTPLDEKTY
jgi:hypothetical protein